MEVQKRSKTSITNFFWSFAPFSLRWITNNNNYYIFSSGALERESEVFRRFAFCFFLLHFPLLIS